MFKEVAECISVPVSYGIGLGVGRLAESGLFFLFYETPGLDLFRPVLQGWGIAAILANHIYWTEIKGGSVE